MSTGLLRQIARRTLPLPVRRPLRGAWDRVVAAGGAVRRTAICGAAARRRRTPRQIVFVSDLPRAREAKLAYGLKHAGWNVILVHRRRPMFDAPQYFTEAVSYRDAAEAVVLAARYTPVAYHVFAIWDFGVAVEMVRRRPGPVVFDDYDVISGMIKEGAGIANLRRCVAEERYCFGHADGLCCRGLESQYLKRVMGYRLSPKRIYFPDYCFANPSPDPAVCGTFQGPSLVYAGRVVSTSHDTATSGNMLPVGRALAEHRIHFHVYPTSLLPREEFETSFRDYFELARRTPFFHMHYCVPHERLLQEMRGHTAGLHIAGINLDLGRLDSMSESIRGRLASTNKLFDYLDAGLPIAICNARHQRWLATRLGAGIPVSPELFEHPHDFLDKLARCRENIPRARDAYSVRKQAARLVHFYESL